MDARAVGAMSSGSGKRGRGHVRHTAHRRNAMLPQIDAWRHSFRIRRRESGWARRYECRQLRQPDAHLARKGPAFGVGDDAASRHGQLDFCQTYKARGKADLSWPLRSPRRRPRRRPRPASFALESGLPCFDRARVRAGSSRLPLVLGPVLNKQPEHTTSRMHDQLIQFAKSTTRKWADHTPARTAVKMRRNGEAEWRAATLSARFAPAHPRCNFPAQWGRSAIFHNARIGSER